MHNILVSLGNHATGTTLLKYLLEEHNPLLGVLCSSDAKQYEDIRTILPEDIPVGVGTSVALLSPRTKDFKEDLPNNLRAWDLFYELVSKQAVIEIIALGSLTNLAISLMRHPELKEKIKRIVFLGGSAKSGDVTPFAEQSIYDDPISAKTIFESEMPIQMLGLELTEEMTHEEKEKALYELFKHPEHFEFKKIHVGIETVSPKTFGMSICDLYGKSSKQKNVELVMNWKEV